MENRQQVIATQAQRAVLHRPTLAVLWLALASIAIGLLAPSARAASPQPSATIFAGRPQVTFAGVDRLPKWQRIADWLRRGEDRRQPALQAWMGWAWSLRALPELRRLSLIQARVNQAFGYASDEDAWGVADYWETPAEVAARGATDCEGFAIFKLWLARNAGIDDSRLGIYVGQIRDGAQHAVLLVQAEGGDFALDSLQAAVTVAESMPDFRPVMLLSLDELHVFVASLPASMSPASRPSR